MVPAIILLLIGIVLIGLGSEALVEFAVKCGRQFGISTLVIGVVVVGFGTSAPELSASLLAVRDDLGLAVSNIIGSNASNLSLALGICILYVGGFVIKEQSISKLAILATGSAFLFAIFIQGKFAIYEGIILLALVPVVISILLRSTKGSALPDEGVDESGRMSKVVNYFVGPSNKFFKQESRTRAIIGLVIALIATVGGAQFLIDGAIRLAAIYGIKTGFLGLTIVAVGTSAPEIIVGIQSVRKKQGELFAGNLLGSTIFNSLFVGGASGVIGSGTLQDGRLATIVTPVSLGVLLLGVFVLSIPKKVKRWHALMLVAAWGVMIGLSI